jgi:hypothetical protein
MTQAKRSSFILAGIAVIFCCAFSCNTQTGSVILPTPAPIADIDGKWSHAASEQMPTVCLTITGRRVTQIDRGCVGADLSIFAQPADDPNDGNLVTLIASAGSDPNDQINFSVFTYQLITQSDGTMRGPALIQEQPSGNSIGATQVIFVRQQ